MNNLMLKKKTQLFILNYFKHHIIASLIIHVCEILIQNY